MGEPRDTAAEMADLLPEAMAIRVGGKDLALTPMRFGQLAACLRVATPVLGEFHQTKGDLEIDVVKLMARHGETLLELCTILTGEKRAWVDALPLDDATRLVGALVQVNRDFFARRMGPALTSVLSTKHGRSSSPTTMARNGTAASAGPTPLNG